MKKLVLKISGMTCDGCAAAIKSFLGGVEGIMELDVSYLDKRGVVVYDPEKIKKTDILSSPIFKGTYGAEEVEEMII